jgi:lipid-A-disaccharide synthase
MNASMDLTDIKAAAAGQIDAGEFFDIKPFPRIAIVAGETSGDNLGAALMHALREKFPAAEFVGIAGPQMRAAGCEAWERAESLAVMGLAEVVPHLRRLMRIRKKLVKRLLADPPDIYIGVDYKEFNLSVERMLKQSGIRTVQYVSPQVWAWRQGRVKKIAQSTDLMLCLLPFEKQFYDGHHVNAAFVGHPLADELPEQVNSAVARQMLDLAIDAPCVAVLPGSRETEVTRLGHDFAKTIAWLVQHNASLQFVAPMANAKVREIFRRCLQQAGVAAKIKLIDGQSQRALAACDVALLASGTATLEAALIKRPMVVAYRVSWFTTFILKAFGLIKTDVISQPNLLSGKKLVPEFVNSQVRADVLGPAVLEQLSRPDRKQLEQVFAGMHLQLRQNASAQAASAIAALLEQAK